MNGIPGGGKPNHPVFCNILQPVIFLSKIYSVLFRCGKSMVLHHAVTGEVSYVQAGRTYRPGQKAPMDISENEIKDITKEQIINDMIKLRQRINDMEKIEEDKKRDVEELDKTKSMFEGLFEFAPDAILVVDREGRIVQANKQVERLFGYTREELLNA